MPKFYVNNLDGRYEAIQDYLKQKYHQPGLTIDGRNIPADQYQDGDAHASDGYTQVDSTHVRCPDGSIKHIERLTK